MFNRKTFNRSAFNSLPGGSSTMSVAITGASAVTAAFIVIEVFSAAVTGTSSGSANPNLKFNQSAAITGSSTVTANIVDIETYAPAFSGTSALTAANKVLVIEQAALAGGSGMAAVDVDIETESAAISGASGMTAQVLDIVTETVAITGTSSVSATYLVTAGPLNYIVNPSLSVYTVKAPLNLQVATELLRAPNIGLGLSNAPVITIGLSANILPVALSNPVVNTKII